MSSPLLRHPVPKHPSYIPEPPASPHGYQRFSSSPAPPNLPPYTPPFPSSNLPAWEIDATTTQLGMRLGHSAVAAGQEYMQRNVSPCVSFPCPAHFLFLSLQFATLFPSTNLKHHFNVSNSYVILKLKLILFPWTHKPWVRRIRRTDNGQSEWQPPRDDINSPDLYIPGLLLFPPASIILLSSLDSHGHRHLHPSHCHSQGFRKELQPQGASVCIDVVSVFTHHQILGESASRAIAVLVLDFVFVKLGCYFLNIHGSGQVVDLIAYGGYKFIGCVFSLAFLDSL